MCLSLNEQACVGCQLGESFVKEIGVQACHRKEADTTMRTASTTGHLAQQGGAGPKKPLIGFSRKSGEVGTTVGRHGLFFWRWGGHINDQRALWRVKTLSIDLDDSVAVFLIKLEDPPVEVVAFFRDVGRVVPG